MPVPQVMRLGSVRSPSAVFLEAGFILGVVGSVDHIQPVLVIKTNIRMSSELDDMNHRQYLSTGQHK